MGSEAKSPTAAVPDKLQETATKKPTEKDATKADAKRKPPYYNPHWKGYSFLLLSTLINMCSTSNVPQNYDYRGSWGVAVAFGSITFALTFLILFFDRTQIGVDTFHFTKAWEGRLEGYYLLAQTFWWIAGVAYITQVKGIAYYVMNVYASAWMSFASAIYTLNQWSSKRDIISFSEMTGVSVTLKSWYILFFASLVVLGTCINFLALAIPTNNQQAIWGVLFGFLSTIFSSAFIMVHYRLLEFCKHGGWQELVTALGLVLMWIIGCAIITQSEAIGATINGQGCEATAFYKLYEENFEGPFAAEAENLTADDVCHVLIWYDDPTIVDENSTSDTGRLAVNATLPCGQLLQTKSELVDDAVEPIPGSNIYVAVWLCLAASIHITLRWKAQQAVQFAAKAEQRYKEGQKNKVNDLQGGGGGDDAASDPDADELDEFEDAVAK